MINHSKDVLEETYDLWDYFDDKRDALERLETYLLHLRDNKRPGAADNVERAPPTPRPGTERLGAAALGGRRIRAPRM